VDDAEITKLGELEKTHWWYTERRTILGRELPPVSGSGIALDIGAAVGANTEVLSRRGWRAAGIDTSLLAAAAISARGFPGLLASACSLPFADRTVGLVVAYDVLEHIPDDLQAVNEIFRVLHPGGHLLVSVPCDMRLWSEHDVAVGHVRRYSRIEIVELLEKAGFDVDHVWSWNVILRPLVAVRRKSSKGSDLDRVPKLTNSVLRGIVAIERYAPLGPLPGVSLFLRVRRPG
jgi:SAM-dependent methyltransferase